MQRWIRNIRKSSSCIFCEVNNTTNKIVFEDDKIIVIEDIKPKALVHLLVLPKEHICSIRELTKSHLELVRHMHNKGKMMLDEKIQEDKQKYGFHSPGFNSVDHLHLHCLGLPYIPSWQRFRFLPFFGAFIAVEDVLESLESKTS